MCWFFGVFRWGLGQDLIHLGQQVVLRGGALLVLQTAHLRHQQLLLAELLGRALLGLLGVGELVVQGGQLGHGQGSQGITTRLLHTLGGHGLHTLGLLLVRQRAAAAALGLGGALGGGALVVLVLLQPGLVGGHDLAVLQGQVVGGGLLQVRAELHGVGGLVGVATSLLQQRADTADEGHPRRGPLLGLLLLTVRCLDLLRLALGGRRGLHRGRLREVRAQLMGQHPNEDQTGIGSKPALDLGTQLLQGHLGHGRHFGY